MTLDETVRRATLNDKNDRLELPLAGKPPPRGVTTLPVIGRVRRLDARSHFHRFSLRLSRLSSTVHHTVLLHHHVFLFFLLLLFFFFASLNQLSSGRF